MKIWIQGLAGLRNVPIIDIYEFEGFTNYVDIDKVKIWVGDAVDDASIGDMKVPPFVMPQQDSHFLELKYRITIVNISILTECSIVLAYFHGIFGGFMVVILVLILFTVRAPLSFLFRLRLRCYLFFPPHTQYKCFSLYGDPRHHTFLLYPLVEPTLPIEKLHSLSVPVFSTICSPRACQWTLTVLPILCSTLECLNSCFSYIQWHFSCLILSTHEYS